MSLDRSSYVKLRLPESKASETKAVTRPSLTLSSRHRGMARKGKHKKAGSRAPNKPPPIDTVSQGHSILRFTATSAAAAVSISIGNVLAAIGGIGTIANSTIESVASSFKLHRVTIWPAVVAAGSSQQAEVVWTNSGNYTRDESKSVAIPSGTAMPDVVVNRPPKDALAAAWQVSIAGTTAMFLLTCPAGSIIDVDVSWTLSNNFAGNTQAGYAAVTQGSAYYARLDGVGGKFLPLGVPTTN